MISPQSSWVSGADPSPYGISALPYGIARRPDGRPSVVVRIGEHALDLVEATAHLSRGFAPLMDQPSLNAFLAAGPDVWREVRSEVTNWLTDPVERTAVEPYLRPLAGLDLRLPFEVADYVDFYSSRYHAENIGAIFRPGQPALPPNWVHLPIGYHGRSGTVVVSGTEIVRPCGQRLPPGADRPVFGPSQRLDIEAEVGFVVGVPSRLGSPISVERFPDHVFGVVLVNDWSARDVQSWESVPLGPFLGKSFATSISAWVLPIAAVESARVDPPARVHELLPYLRDREPWGLDIVIDIIVNGTVVARPPFTLMYWTAAQQLAHLTGNGAAVRTGDLLASGTVSGPRADQRGSLIELTWNGERPIALADGSTRRFLADGDEVVLTATLPGPGGARIGLGEVRGRVRPAGTATPAR